jgi:hypothetical protein
LEARAPAGSLSLKRAKAGEMRAEIRKGHDPPKRQRETRGDQAAMIGIAIVGRKAELVRQGARRNEGGSKRRKNKQPH